MTRGYDSSRREEAARQAQTRVVEIAHRLLVERGYSGLTMADLARESGVSVPQLYKAFGPKPRLVKRVYDVRLAGDTHAVPMADRPWVQAIDDEPDPRRKLAIYASVSRGMAHRAGPLTAALMAAARSGEPELAEFAATIDVERLHGAAALAGHLADSGALAPSLPIDRARDLIWLHTAPDTYRLLVLHRGWSLDEYEHWLAGSLAAALLPSGGPAEVTDTAPSD